VGDKAINLNQQLNEIESLFSTGHIKKAQKDLRKLNSQFGKGKPIPSKFRHKFQRLNFTAKEYDDWAEFATSDKRTELINEVNKLQAEKLEPRSLANRINSLQKQWQNLDQHGKTASKEKWSTFKDACEKAWAPCKDYFAVLEDKKEENRDKKLALLKDIFIKYSDNEIYQILTKKIKPNQKFKFLFDKMPNVTRNKIKDGIKSGKVLVNKGPIKPSYKVKPLDKVEVSLDREKRNNQVSTQHRYIVFCIHTSLRIETRRRRIYPNGHGRIR